MLMAVVVGRCAVVSEILVAIDASNSANKLAFVGFEGGSIAFKIAERSPAVNLLHRRVRVVNMEGMFAEVRLAQSTDDAVDFVGRIHHLG